MQVRALPGTLTPTQIAPSPGGRSRPRKRIHVCRICCLHGHRLLTNRSAHEIPQRARSLFVPSPFLFRLLIVVVVGSLCWARSRRQPSIRIVSLFFELPRKRPPSPSRVPNSDAWHCVRSSFRYWDLLHVPLTCSLFKVSYDSINQRVHQLRRFRAANIS